MVFITAGSAQAVIVQGTELPSYTVQVTNQLGLSHGVNFTSTMGFVTFGDNGNSVTGIYGTDPSFNPNAGYASYYSPIEATFVSMNDGFTPAVVNGTVSAVFGDGGGDTDGIRMRAFDINNNLIDTQTALSISWGNISITANGIHKVIFDQSGLGDGTSDTFLDWLMYPTPSVVPAPGTLAVLCGFMCMRRRRR